MKTARYKTLKEKAERYANSLEPIFNATMDQHWKTAEDAYLMGATEQTNPSIIIILYVLISYFFGFLTSLILF